MGTGTGGAACWLATSRRRLCLGLGLPHGTWGAFSCRMVAVCHGVHGAGCGSLSGSRRTGACQRRKRRPLGFWRLSCLSAAPSAALYGGGVKPGRAVRRAGWPQPTALAFGQGSCGGPVGDVEKWEAALPGLASGLQGFGALGRGCVVELRGQVAVRSHWAGHRAISLRYFTGYWTGPGDDRE